MIALLNNFVNVNQFRIRGRGRARGVFAGTNTGPNNSNTTFQKRPKEEEWDPEYTPKSKKYFLHDDRDDGVDYWAKRGRGHGTFQRGRGRFNFKNQVAVQSGLMTNTKGMGLLKMKKRPWRTVKKKRTDARRKKNRECEVRLQQTAELAPTNFFFT